MSGIAFALSMVGLSLLWGASSARKGHDELVRKGGPTIGKADGVSASRIDMLYRVAGPARLAGVCLLTAGLIAAVAAIAS